MIKTPYLSTITQMRLWLFFFYIRFFSSVCTLNNPERFFSLFYTSLSFEVQKLLFLIKTSIFPFVSNTNHLFLAANNQTTSHQNHA
jgi:hypothetical protein